VTAAASWPIWSTTAHLVVTRPDVLGQARELVEDQLAQVGAAASRFRPDSEINTVQAHAGRLVPVSDLLADLVAAGLDAAAHTDGDVDPTIGGALSAMGYDRDIDEIRSSMQEIPHVAPFRVVRQSVPGWRSVELRRSRTGSALRIPPGLILDLGATAKAWTADRCARLVAGDLGTGVLVNLGGDLATAGPAPFRGWHVDVADQPEDPRCRISLGAGSAVATSSTTRRRWRVGDTTVHHILDPRTGLPVEAVWRSVTVAADSCLDANTASTAAIVRGRRAPGWLRTLGLPARLLGSSGEVITVGDWPRS